MSAPGGGGAYRSVLPLRPLARRAIALETNTSWASVLLTSLYPSFAPLSFSLTTFSPSGKVRCSVELLLHGQLLSGS